MGPKGTEDPHSSTLGLGLQNKNHTLYSFGAIALCTDFYFG